jgi:hypothetical protein
MEYNLFNTQIVEMKQTPKKANVPIISNFKVPTDEGVGEVN